MTRNRTGAALVEAVIVLALLLMLVFAVFEYGWMFIKGQEIANAARHGARLAVRPDATTEEVVSAVRALLSRANISEYEIGIQPGDVRSPLPGQALTVEVRAPYFGYLDVTHLFQWLTVPEYLSFRVTMAKEGA